MRAARVQHCAGQPEARHRLQNAAHWPCSPSPKKFYVKTLCHKRGGNGATHEVAWKVVLVGQNLMINQLGEKAGEHMDRRQGAPVAIQTHASSHTAAHRELTIETKRVLR